MGFSKVSVFYLLKKDFLLYVLRQLLLLCPPCKTVTGGKKNLAFLFIFYYNPVFNSCEKANLRQAL